MSMSIQDALKHAAEKIGGGLLTAEEQVKLAVIIPTLHSLGWDYANPAEFLPEYPVSGYSEGRGRVDFALLQRSGAPLVFVEAKRLGGLSVAGQNQLFDYAHGQGIPLLVLTDGETWDFYLGMAAGVPAERRFYRAELRHEEKIPELASHFESYLRKSRVLSGEARLAAEKFHKSMKGREEAKRVMPEVWRKLLQEDDMLRDLLAEAVESECGTKPDLDDAGDFLGKQADLLHIVTSPTPPASPAPNPGPLDPSARERNKRIVGYVLDGQRVKVRAGNRTLAEVLKAFHSRHSGFMQKYAHVTKGRTRRLVAQNRDDLNSNKDMLEHSQDLGNGWWMTTNLSNVNIRNYARQACEVAGIRFGADLKLIER